MKHNLNAARLLREPKKVGFGKLKCLMGGKRKVADCLPCNHTFLHLDTKSQMDRFDPLGSWRYFTIICITSLTFDPTSIHNSLPLFRKCRFTLHLIGKQLRIIGMPFEHNRVNPRIDHIRRKRWRVYRCRRNSG